MGSGGDAVGAGSHAGGGGGGGVGSYFSLGFLLSRAL